MIRLCGSVMRGPESQQLETLVPELASGGCKKIVFDLAEVKRIDSTGIGRFISCLNQASEAGIELRMAAAAGYVRECFKVTRLDTVFRFCPTVEEACLK